MMHNNLHIAGLQECGNFRFENFEYCAVVSKILIDYWKISIELNSFKNATHPLFMLLLGGGVVKMQNKLT
jgi:hypothetical protein